MEGRSGNPYAQKVRHGQVEAETLANQKATSAIEQGGSRSQLMHSDNSYDLVRLTAAVGVMVSHSLSTTPPIFSFPEPAVAIFKRLSLGDFGVFVFFALSGYLICSSLIAGGRGFVLRRVARIVPGLAVCVLFCAAVMAPFAPSMLDYLSSRPLYVFLLDALVFPLAHNPVPSITDCPYPACTIVGQFWTLCYEVLAYTFLGLIFWLFRDRARPAAVVFFMGAVAAFIESCINAPHVASFQINGIGLFHADTRSMALLSALFFAGALLRFWRDHVPLVPLVGASIVLLAMIAVVTRLSEPETGRAFAEFAVIFSVPPIVIALGSLPSRLSKFIGARVGDISYGVYIYHLVMIFLAWKLLLPVIGGWGVPVSYLATIALAYASFHLIERPAIQAARLVGRHTTGR